MFRFRTISLPAILVPILTLTLPPSSPAGVIRVPEDEPTITAGLHAAVAGDTVDVACGTYHEHGLPLRNGVTLRSRTGQPDCVTVDGDQLSAVVDVSGTDILVEGLTLVGGRSQACGGISVTWSSNARIHRCVIRDNSAVSGALLGAGILSYQSDVEVTFTEIVQNGNGWAVHTYQSGVTMANCTVADNQKAIYVQYGTSAFDRCIFANNGGPGNAECSCFWPGSSGGTNFTADPLFCDPASGNYNLQSGSPCLPGENACGLVGANTLGCGTPSLVPVTVDTSPSGLPVVVDGVTYVGPADFNWYQYSRHVLGADTTPGSGGTRYRFESWSDDGAATHETWVPTLGETYVATFYPQHHLSMTNTGTGSTSPPDGWYDEGTPVTISATPDPDQYLEVWAGTGTGSYSGLDNPAQITVDGPIMQLATFAPIAFDFTISASSTDPFVTRDRAAMDTRPLWLWITCSNAGISAFEAGVTGTLYPTVFVPENGVLNAGSATYLLLAIPGCPTGTDVPMRLGHWLVGDGGGRICLDKAPSTNRITGVNCAATPGLVILPRVVGFRSDGGSPCAMGTDRCGSPSVPAAYVTVDVPVADLSAGPLRVLGPNPFGRSTRFSFGLDRAATVRMSVYDILGRKVRTLTAGGLGAGPHAVEWDGTSDDGKALPSGVYVVRLDRGGTAEARKVTLIRR